MKTSTAPDEVAGDPALTGEFRPLAAQPLGQVVVSFGALSHPGKVRSNNEDQFFVARLCKSMRVWKSSMADPGSVVASEEDGHLLMVADGMGGAAAGEEASAVAVLTVEDFALNTLKWFIHLGGNEEPVLLAELRAGIERADREVIARAKADPRLHGMGTTLTVAYSVGRELFIVHAGDTRAYLFHEGSLQQITRDHTLVQLLVNNGALSPEDAKRHKRRNVVTNVVGGPNAGVFAEVYKVEVADGDVLLLCSDGLSEPVGDDRIAEVLAAEADPEMACTRLIDAAIERGGPDNVTAVIARYRVS